MSGQVIFLTHGDVHIDPAVAIPDWGLAPRGRARHRAFAADPVLDGVTTIFCSTERKAVEAADLSRGDRAAIPRPRAALGENDRSATGYLPRDAFEATADAFFARPDDAVRGWEPASHAQTRIVRAIGDALTEVRPAGDILIVAHGAVAALLRCHLLGCAITRDEDQPGPKGGCWFTFPATLRGAPSDWNTI